ncbi:TPA: LVIVD repeat-containing protein [Klebsiella oxytoca]
MIFKLKILSASIILLSTYSMASDGVSHKNATSNNGVVEHFASYSSSTHRSQPLLKNMELIGYNDLGGKPGFQMAMQKANGRYYLYTASFRNNGWNILDVTEPTKPRNIKWLEGPWLNDQMKDGQSTPKIQLADGFLITAHGGTLKELHGTDSSVPYWGGIMIWDVKTDPENPKLLSKFECKGGTGVHRFFYNGGRYVYVTGSAEGFNGFILRIVDIQDPKNPKEVGRWWTSEQYLNDKEDANAARYGSAEALASPFLHALVVKGDIGYLAYANKGLIILDLKEKTNPKMIGHLSMNPPFGGGEAGAPMHSVLPLGDRPYVVVTTEGERAPYFSNEATEGLFKKIKTQPMNMIGIVEITDPGNPHLISVFPYPEVPKGYTHGKNFNIVDGVRIPFGPHNIFDAFGPEVYGQRNDRVYNAYFNAGLRVYDVSDPFVPKEIAYFLPPDPSKELFNNKEGTLFPGPKVAITEDVLVDDRGYIYVDTFMDGLYILKSTI